jgi:hypothetical protein
MKMAATETAQTQPVGPAPTGDLIGPEQAIEEYVKKKIVKNGGRPHFVSELAGDPKEQLLNILEDAWIKNRQTRGIAKEYKASYKTIERLLQDFEPHKATLVHYLQITTRIKRFYHDKTDSSDFETVQNYIRRAHRDGLRRYKINIHLAEKCYHFLNYKDPAKWTAEEVLKFLETKTGPAQSTYLDGIRQCAPQLMRKGGEEELKVGRFREKRGGRKKQIFGNQYQMTRECLRALGLNYELDIMDLHVALGAREGSHGIDPRSGLSGLTWDRFNDNFHRVDLFESKVRGGIWWRDCPLDLLFADLPDRLRQMWTEKGKPINDHLIDYSEICRVYKRIREALAQYYEGKLDPGLYKQLTTIRPHDADRIHVNLLWEADVPLEVVAGEYLGHAEAVGIVGRGWLNIEVIKKHYLSLTKESEKFKKVHEKIVEYSRRFNGHRPAAEPEPAIPTVVA